MLIYSAHHQLQRMCFNCKTSVESTADKVAKVVHCGNCTEGGGAIYCSQACYDKDWHLHRAICKKQATTEFNRVWIYTEKVINPLQNDEARQKTTASNSTSAASSAAATSVSSASSANPISTVGFDYVELTYDPQSKEITSHCLARISSQAYSSTHFNHLKGRVDKKQVGEIVVVAKPSGQADYTALYMFKNVHFDTFYKPADSKVRDCIIS